MTAESSPVRRYSDAAHLEDIRRSARPLSDEEFLLRVIDQQAARISELTAVLKRAGAEAHMAPRSES